MRQVLHPHVVAGRGGKGGGGDVFERRQALGQRVDRNDQHARPLDRASRTGEPREHGHPLGGDGCVGRHAVVGLAVPRWQIERFDLRGGEGERVDEGLCPQTVPGEEDERRGPPLAGLGEGVRKLRHDEGVVAFGRAAERDGAALAEAMGGGREVDRFAGLTALSSRRSAHLASFALLTASRGAAETRANRGVS